ncbi:MAG: tRNA pseudouridine(65) synthase TruC [Thiotrichaceae bacterium]|nr:tRNA pseudouridine(65) synthase TruC [Thiotrichaceae bacterium]
MLEILLKDEYLVAINKPSGLLVHKSPIDKRETEFALQMVRDQIGQYVYPIHRLDKPTSGILIFALSSEVAALMSKQIRDHDFHKEYLAVVRGYTKEKELIDHDLTVILDKKADKDRSDDKEPQSAQTYYERLNTVELPYPVSRYPASRYSVVKLIPSTGRKHQLRRHMKHIFHPIVGDTRYGRTEHNNLFREQFDCHRLLLHASRLSFTHPITNETIVIDAQLDTIFSKVLALFDE